MTVIRLSDFGCHLHRPRRQPDFMADLASAVGKVHFCPEPLNHIGVLQLNGRISSAKLWNDFFVLLRPIEGGSALETLLVCQHDMLWRSVILTGRARPMKVDSGFGDAVDLEQEVLARQPRLHGRASRPPGLLLTEELL